MKVISPLWQPEGTCFSDLLECRKELSHILRHMRDVIRIHPPAEKLAGKHFDKVRQRENSIYGFRIKAVPIPQMFFRPEEEHRASGKACVFPPFQEGNGHMSYQPFRIGIENFAVLDFHPDGLSAVQARRVDLDSLSRK